jgi:Flp pilus assembly protein TadG
MVETLRTERGQALVEFVIVLPLIFALIFLVVYAGIGFNRHLLVTDAARVAARAGAVARFDAREPCEAARDAAANSVGGLSIDVTCASSGLPGDPFSVTVRHVLDIRLPLLPLEDVDLESTATERLE